MKSVLLEFTLLSCLSCLIVLSCLTCYIVFIVINSSNVMIGCVLLVFRCLVLSVFLEKCFVMFLVSFVG